MPNNGAYALAASGSKSFTEDDGIAVVREFALTRIRKHWGSLLKVYKMVRGQAQRRAQEGLVARCKLLGPGSMPREQRTQARLSPEFARGSPES